VSRVINRAPLAVTSDGDVLLNIARFDEPKKIEEIVRMAVRQRGAIFIGIALSRREVKRLLDDAAMVLPNLTATLEGKRQRGPRRGR
jgi:hypothetical protein